MLLMPLSPLMERVNMDDLTNQKEESDERIKTDFSLIMSNGAVIQSTGFASPEELEALLNGPDGKIVKIETLNTPLNINTRHIVTWSATKLNMGGSNKIAPASNSDKKKLGLH